MKWKCRATDEFKKRKKKIVLMTKVVPYDATGGGIVFLGLKSGQKQGGAVYAPVPQKLYQQVLKHSNIC